MCLLGVDAANRYTTPLVLTQAALNAFFALNMYLLILSPQGEFLGSDYGDVPNRHALHVTTGGEGSSPLKGPRARQSGPIFPIEADGRLRRGI